MSSSSEALVLRGEVAGSAAPLRTPDLRSGTWTRHGGSGALGDTVTEQMLGVLADDVRAAAQAQGYAVGWAEGRRAAAGLAAAVRREQEVSHQRSEDDHAEERAVVLAGLVAATERLTRLASEAAARIEEQATELARELTREILGHELSAEDGGAVVRRVLAVLPADGIAHVRLHPDALADADLLTHRPGVRVTASRELEPGDAVVELDDRLVDLRIAEACARVREALA